MHCDECRFNPRARGLCNRHYIQIRRHGFTFATWCEPRFAIQIEDNWYLPLGVNAQDGYVMIDEEDKYLDKYKWHLSHGYPASKQGLLHRMIMDAPENLDVDHINGDVLDCSKRNLRLCTRAQNNMNRVKNNKTGFKGVYWHDVAGKYAARIMYKKKSYHLGLYLTATEAARAYDKKASEFFGEFARLNYAS